MMEPANRDRIFVADLAAKRARLGEANMMGFARASDRKRRKVRS